MTITGHCAVHENCIQPSALLVIVNPAYCMNPLESSFHKTLGSAQYFVDDISQSGSLWLSDVPVLQLACGGAPAYWSLPYSVGERMVKIETAGFVQIRLMRVLTETWPSTSHHSKMSPVANCKMRWKYFWKRKTSDVTKFKKQRADPAVVGNEPNPPN